MSEPTSQPPFTEMHRRMVDEGLRELQQAKEYVEAGESCGMDCDLHKEMIKHLEDGLNGFKQQFFRGAKGSGRVG